MTSLNMIQHGRYNRAFQKFLSLKGPAQVTDIAAEIFPVINTFYGAENRYLESWDRFTLGSQIAAGAGNQGGFEIRNPSGSNVIAVIEKVRMACSSATTWTMSAQQGGSDLTTIFPGTIFAYDNRGRGSPTCVLSHAEAVTVADAIVVTEIMVVPVNQTLDVIFDENQEIPILPGEQMRFVQHATLAATNTWSIVFRERFLEESERT